jgi:hypothetical protein
MLLAAAGDERPRGLGRWSIEPLDGLLRMNKRVSFSKNYAGFIPVLPSISSASLTSNLWLETKKFLANVKEVRNGKGKEGAGVGQA